MIGLPLLIAWQHRTFWTLFDVREAVTSGGHYRIDFSRAMVQNLLMLLAGDFSYRLAPGTAIRMRIKKLSSPNARGGFIGTIEDVHFVNPAGETVPDIPHLSSLFLFWENVVDQVDEDDAVVHGFVVPTPEVEYGEFASRTLSKLLQSFSSLKGRDLNLREVMHDLGHWVHNSGEFRRIVDQGAQYDVFTHVFRARPSHIPAFLKDLEF